MSEQIIRNVAGVGRTISKKITSLERQTPNIMALESRLSTVESSLGIGEWKRITANYTCVAGDRLIINTTLSSLILTLPDSPALGDTIEFIDDEGTFQINNLILDRNGEKIMGLYENTVCAIEDIRWKMTFIDGEDGWKISY